MPDEGRPRRRRWPLVVAVAAIVALLAGIGGVMIGRATAPGPTIVVAPGPVVQQSPAASALPVSPGEGRPGLVVTTTTPSLPVVFTAAPDLPDTPSVATGYQLSRGQVDGAALAGTLADAFGVSGDVAQTADSWLVGSTDGSAPTVTVVDDPLLSWSFVDPVAQESTVGVAIDPDVAREQAAELLGSIGVDLSTVDWQVDRFADQTRVTAWQVLAGSRTDLAWVVSVGKDGAVVEAEGFAAGIVEIPGYATVGAATAVRRSAAPTWAAVGPLPVSTTAVTGSPAASSPSAPSTSVPERPALSVPIARIEIVDAELGLAQYRQPDGAILILPSYRVGGSDGSQWSVLALTAVDVDFVDTPYPAPTASGP